MFKVILILSKEVLFFIWVIIYSNKVLLLFINKGYDYIPILKLP